MTKRKSFMVKVYNERNILYTRGEFDSLNEAKSYERRMRDTAFRLGIKWTFEIIKINI